MSEPADDLRTAAMATLTAAGFSEVAVVRQSDTVLIASVPKARRPWLDFALRSFTTLPLEDRGNLARLALFPAPEGDEAYSRAVYYRASGDGLPESYLGKELYQAVQLVPGRCTEADIPKILASGLFGTETGAHSVTIMRIV
ncbi:hypothetical protein [Streptomyces syringium]|uniref:hypothetical protein n=1 Tax=Streptomyces syringium TaxID=76729 RepID=UPI0037D5B754